MNRPSLLEAEAGYQASLSGATQQEPAPRAFAHPLRWAVAWLRFWFGPSGRWLFRWRWYGVELAVFVATLRFAGWFGRRLNRQARRALGNATDVLVAEGFSPNPPPQSPGCAFENGPPALH